MNIFEEYKARHSLTFPCIKRAAPVANIICKSDGKKTGKKWLALTISQQKKDHQPATFIFQWNSPIHNGITSHGVCIHKTSDAKEIEWDDYETEIIKTALRKDIQPIYDKNLVSDALWEIFVTAADDKLAILPKKMRCKLINTLIETKTADQNHKEKELILDYIRNNCSSGLYGAWQKLCQYSDPNTYGFWFGEVFDLMKNNENYREEYTQTMMS